MVQLLPRLPPAVNLEFNAHFTDAALENGLTIVECPITFHERVGVGKGGQPLLEFVFRVDPDVALYRTRQFGEEAFDDIESRPVGRCEGEGEASDRLRRQPTRRLA